MRVNFLMTCFAIGAVIIVITFFLTVPGTWLPQEEKVSQPSENQPREQEDYAYELRDYQGKLAVFPYGEERPRKVFDVYVNTLPEYDREQLTAGVPVKDYEELLLRIEDYSS